MMKEEIIIQFLDSLNKTNEKYLNSIIEYYGYYILYDLITSALIAFLTAFVIYLFHKKYPKNRENEIIVFAKICLFAFFGFALFYSIQCISEYFVYIQNPLGATLNYLINGR